MNQRNENLAEALECCREGDLDRLADFPELRELAAAAAAEDDVAAELASIQANDAILASALRETNCPAGLADRIAARIEAAECSSASTNSAPSGPAPVDLTSSDPTLNNSNATAVARPAKPNAKPFGRRRAWGVIATVAALLLLAAVPVFWPARTRGRAELVGRTNDWRKTLATAVWRTANPPKDRPWSPHLAFAPEQVAVVSTAEDRHTTVYRYDRPLRNRRGSVHLFVVKTASAGLPAAPPSQPDFDSGGIRVGVWSENGMVYALVVVGNGDAYRRMVGRPSRSA